MTEEIKVTGKAFIVEIETKGGGKIRRRVSGTTEEVTLLLVGDVISNVKRIKVYGDGKIERAGKLKKINDKEAVA